jgi:hypothetical protein
MPGDEQVWVSGGLRVRDEQDVTFTAPSRTTVGDLTLLTLLDEATPAGELNLVSDHRSSYTSGPIQEWLGKHPRVHPMPIPTGTCWLNLQAGWWRLFRRAAFAGQSFADVRGDRSGDPGGHTASERAGQAVGVGPPTSTTAHASSTLCLQPLRNGALTLHQHFPNALVWPSPGAPGTSDGSSARLVFCVSLRLILGTICTEREVSHADHQPHWPGHR